MSQPTAALTPGFAHPVHDAQRTFRAVLEAMARPLTPQPLGVPLSAPAPLTAEAGVVVLTLCDEQTPLWLDEALRGSTEVTTWIRFHTGAPLVDDAAQALFCLASSPQSAPPLDTLNLGTDQEPHHSATVIIEAAEGAEGSCTAAGPGIRESLTWNGAGLPPSFLKDRQRLTEAFPRGVDLLFLTPGAVSGLPRTTRLSLIGDI